MIYRNSAADETVVAITSVKNIVRSIKIRQHKTDAPVLYLQMFNNASPTLGVTKPNKVVEIPAGIPNQAAYVTEGINGNFGGKYFTTALAIAVATTPDGATAPDAGDEPEVVIDYQALA